MVFFRRKPWIFWWKHGFLPQILRVSFWHVPETTSTVLKILFPEAQRMHSVTWFLWPLQLGSVKLTSKCWKWKCSTWSSFRNLQKSTKMLEDFTILMALKDMMDHSDVKLRYGFVKSQALCSSIPPYFNSHRIQIGDLLLLHPKKNPWNPHVWWWHHRLRRDIEIIIPLRMMFLPTPKKNSNFIKTTWSNGEKIAFSRFTSPKYPYVFSWISSISIFFMFIPWWLKPSLDGEMPIFDANFPHEFSANPYPWGPPFIVGAGSPIDGSNGPGPKTGGIYPLVNIQKAMENPSQTVGKP